jgi:hypothetical protein
MPAACLHSFSLYSYSLANHLTRIEYNDICWASLVCI